VAVSLSSRIALWRKEVENGVRILAAALAPLAHAGANIHVVMAYRDPGMVHFLPFPLVHLLGSHLSARSFFGIVNTLGSKFSLEPTLATRTPHEQSKLVERFNHVTIHSGSHTNSLR
jgi:hypothetical protein